MVTTSVNVDQGLIGEDQEAVAVVTIHIHIHIHIHMQVGIVTTIQHHHQEVEVDPIHLKTHHIPPQAMEITHHNNLCHQKTIMVGTKDHLQQICLNRLVMVTTTMVVHHLPIPCSLTLTQWEWAHLLLLK